ncbi:carbon-nitrogen hydrolase family protein [Ruminococcus gauvreauii]|uniref:Carbon-nitrogen hydrolase family protein n=1 Tax=Ruminococcus gauvreauii TaxID=438033 RepID=A0ABY5VG91_9FIRM|nr:carbon-nitrogen hydrolase family protein [Ruminococcus gauvreauii]UWP59387.1 carbon-nitrogen hydrolase family protein [Ruminococcus gauvreauii]
MNKIMTLAVVNFRSIAGDSRRNLSRIIEYTETAVTQGAKLIIFPELALTGYSSDGGLQSELAETLPGRSVSEVAELTRKLGVYVVFGMPVRRDNVIYNSLVICGPCGIEAVYDKLHLTAGDAGWAAQGESLPPVIETPYGKVMAATGYDLLYFPEVVRYAKARGVKLLISASALEDKGMGAAWQKILGRHVGLNTLHIATANLTGKVKTRTLPGGSHILSPAEPIEQTYIAAGYTLDDPAAQIPGVHLAAIDLTADTLMPHYPYFEHNYKVGTPDWRPDVYKRMTEEILARKSNTEK